MALSAIMALSSGGCDFKNGNTGENGGGRPDNSAPVEKPKEENGRHLFGEWQDEDGETVRVCSGCGKKESKIDVSKDGAAITLTADMGKGENLSLLKKITMYNAGTVDPISNYERDMPLIEAMNAESLRIDLSIGKGEGGRNYTGGENLVTGTGDDWRNYRYDFTQLDGIVAQLQEKDVLPYLSWCYVPKPLQPADLPDTKNWTTLNTSLPNWREAWQQVYYNYVKHYVDAGVQIGYHEVLNEPDLWGVFMDYGQFKSGLYNDLYILGARGIREADPDATVGGPAFALAQSASETGFINAVKSAGAPMDFYSFHTYNGLSNLDYTGDLIAKDDYFVTTAFHINEYSWLNSENGGQAGAQSEFNTYRAAQKTLTAIMDVVERTDVQWAHWAQFMESTCGADPYGLIFRDGHVKAAYNAIKIYNDAPVWRYSVRGAQSGLKAVCSADETKIGYIVWNTTDQEKKVNLNVTDSPFERATRRVYRVDERHASYLENPSAEHLVAEDVGGVDADGTVWSGTIPANGVVYVTLNKDGYEDFRAWSDRNTSFATDVKTSYYYADRANLSRVRSGESSYSHFDRNNWTMYLSCGGYNDGHADASVVAKNLPEEFFVRFKTEGNVRAVDQNSALAFRIDFYDETEKAYTSSVLFHNGIYDMSRNAKLAPWGTGKEPDSVIEFSGDLCDIKLSDYAPADWNRASGKAQVSFIMQNTGANTRASIKLY